MNFIHEIDKDVTTIVQNSSKILQQDMPNLDEMLLSNSSSCSQGRIYGMENSNAMAEFKSSIFDNVIPFEILMREEFSDVNLVIGTNIIAVHQIILASHSNFLERILKDHNKLKEYGINENDKFRERLHLLDKTSVVLSEFSLKAVTKMVHFLYSGELISDSGGLGELKNLASALEMQFLETQVIELETRLSIENKNEGYAQNASDKDIIKKDRNIEFNLNDSDMNNDGKVQNKVVLEDNSVPEADDLTNATFITLSGLENLGDGEVIIGQKEMIITDETVIIEKGVEDKVDQNTDLETPIQSPSNETNYVQCDLCHISCTDLDYLKRHKKAKHDIDIFDGLEGLLFTCSHCEHTTSSKNNLSEHYKTEHYNKDHQCEICHKYFVSFSKLEEHRLVHTGEKSFVCNTCGKAFSRSYHLKVHKRIHTGEKPYKCGQCYRTFIDSSALRGHMRSHSEEKPHKCKTCEKCFKDKGNLKQHEATHKTDRPHKCEFCGQSFTFKRNMLRHAEIHVQLTKPIPNHNTVYKCDFCDQIFTSEACLLEHNKEKHPNDKANTNNFVFKCYHRNCERVFPSEKMFKSHYELVHEEKHEESAQSQGPYSCQYCGVQFINIKTLRQHSKTSHSSVGTFKCALCNKGFKNECDLKSHLKDHTDKRKKYICDYCSKAWDRPSDLLKHIRVHTGDKPFQCKECDKRFSDKSLFLKHVRTHNTGETSIFVCGICDKKFQIEINLEKHLKTHTAASYACSSCGKKFYDEISLGAHINLHNGVKPYNCTFCNKDFVQLADLKKHERIHTGEKPFKCMHCERQFSDNSALKKHERRHLKVSNDEQFRCFGCEKNFLKEESFFKHATLFCSGSHKNKKCLGKPKEVPENFPTGAIVRCLDCKITLQHTEDLKIHLENTECKGPIYAKVTGSKSHVHSEIKIVNISDDNFSHLDSDATETLTTIVEIDPVKPTSEDSETSKETSVMKVITQLNEMAEAIHAPKSSTTSHLQAGSKTVNEDKENLI